MRQAKLYVFAALFVIAMIKPPVAHAHGVSVFGYEDAGQVLIEGHFHDGSPCRGSSIKVIKPDTGETLIKGRTNHEGELTIPPFPEPVLITISDGTGHASRYLYEPEMAGSTTQGQRPGPTPVKALAGLAAIAAGASIWMLVQTRRRRRPDRDVQGPAGDSPKGSIK